MNDVLLPEGFQLEQQLSLVSPTGERIVLTKSLISALSVALIHPLCEGEPEEEGNPLAVWAGGTRPDNPFDVQDEAVTLGDEFVGYIANSSGTTLGSPIIDELSSGTPNSGVFTAPSGAAGVTFRNLDSIGPLTIDNVSLIS